MHKPAPAHQAAHPGKHLGDRSDLQDPASLTAPGNSKGSPYRLPFLFLATCLLSVASPPQRW